ncbi:MAG: YeeE/YedE family protein [Desulfofustis sp. PB-SRB1]|jgi:uncharacterized membrane protein YedE/YeeE|nr:YeeE/YedE family protein [Desulfofustis sp. PB-SRB1]MBM1001085.1 YeeE/YedE family protein [Desulfofustis sp. PB-SRB1]HBH30172.1 hypothetical protein [Desulfofustis sp.]
MNKLLTQTQWNWLTSGVALGVTFLLAVLLVKPIGVSTQFVIFDGIVWNLFSNSVVQVDEGAKSGYTSANSYLAKSGGKYAENVANPFNYSFIFVIAMIGGGFLAARLQGEKTPPEQNIAPDIWRDTFGDSLWRRYAAVFLGGILVLFGARLAGGCTSGHMMSGMMQTSLSGYLFAMGAFAAAVPVALLLYKRRN